MSQSGLRDSRAALRTFEALLDIAERRLAARKLDQAAMVLQIAAEFASHNYVGVLSSTRAERLTVEIGRRLWSADGRGGSSAQPVRRRGGSLGPPLRSGGSKDPPLPGPPRTVLHVMTKASAIGGTTRTVLNWIAQDRRRVHSVALTSQGEQQVPAQFADAVAATGGTVKIIDTGVPRLTDRARRLRAHMRGFDLVDLIPIPYDVVPWLASVDASALPPLLMVDHCDHMFWLGSSIADAIAHMREAGAALGRSSRGITADRQTLLPIPLELRSRTRDRAAAKAELGLPADAVVLLTVARRGKYKPVQTPGFFDLVDEVLRRHRQALLVAIGPSPSDPWIRLGDDTRDRVIALGERPASSAYFEAADVYLDSFPFASNTSLMEAGLLETPLVSCCRFDPEAEIMHPGAPGLDRSVIRATTGDEYIAALSALVESSERRREVGEQTRAVIAAAHCGEGWQRYLEEAYRFAASRPRQREVAVAAQHPDHDGPLGQALPGLALGFGLAGVAESHLDRQPATVRLPLLRRLRAIDPACSRSLALPRTIRRWIEKPAT